ncbi:MAG: hypothetical protein UU32_C0017G0008 [Candidatus Woesebacteria bacterium GW2011_GWB1_41_10]|uniref:GatB/Yqey n=1 Tax=Candidatus Woesebacteria bacterium GW2011_GWB1_41_10 TaxID=1618577 RepID=A0A0G0WPB9_9BACT|nr:MAG: hypothetical protein UU32_C0017G0008 [Candidatus Woesebacteria bacterium GW2011_GWB1_41_10]
MTAQTLQQMIGEAMKAHDEVRVSTLRLLSSAFNYEKIERRHELTESEEEGVIRKEAKKRKDAVDIYKKAGVNDRAEKEQKELEILQEFLPPEMGEEEIRKIVDEVMTPGMQIGQIIGAVKAKAPSADGAKVAEIVRSKLSG